MNKLMSISEDIRSLTLGKITL